MDNVYVQFGLAMCVIVLLALIGSSWLAVRMNRSAKQDLQAALEPLAAVVNGTVSLEDASVSGRYAGHLAEGRMMNAATGPGRVFRSQITDPAGGVGWSLTSNPGKREGRPPERVVETTDDGLRARLNFDWDNLVGRVADPARDRFRLEYDPESGSVRFIRPMRTRRDLPTAEQFRAQLDMLVHLAQQNRVVQGAPNADWVGGRRPATHQGGSAVADGARPASGGRR